MPYMKITIPEMVIKNIWNYYDILGTEGSLNNSIKVNTSHFMSSCTLNGIEFPGIVKLEVHVFDDHIYDGNGIYFVQMEKIYRSEEKPTYRATEISLKEE